MSQPLTEHQVKVACLVARGLSDKQIARELSTTIGGVHMCLMRIYRNLGLCCRVELAIYALKKKFIRLKDIELPGGL